MVGKGGDYISLFPLVLSYLGRYDVRSEYSSVQLNLISDTNMNLIS